MSSLIAPLGKKERKTATFSKNPAPQILLAPVLSCEHFQSSLLQNVDVSFVKER